MVAVDMVEMVVGLLVVTFVEVDVMEAVSSIEQ